MTNITKTIPEIIEEYQETYGSNSYRKLSQDLANPFNYPSYGTLFNWKEKGAQPDPMKLRLIENEVQTDEARALVRALLAALE